MAAIGSNANFSLDFRRTADEEQRPYFVIRENDGVRLNPIENLADKLRNKNLEVLNINDDYRNSLALPANYRGIAVFIQNHVAGDNDHAHGMHAGANIFETFKTIARTCRFDLDDHTVVELQQVQQQRQGLGEAADAVMPQYEALDQLLAVISPEPAEVLAAPVQNEPVNAAPIQAQPIPAAPVAPAAPPVRNEPVADDSIPMQSRPVPAAPVQLNCLQRIWAAVSKVLKSIVDFFATFLSCFSNANPVRRTPPQNSPLIV